MLTTSCGLFQIDKEVSRKAKFEITNPDSLIWREVKIANVDVAFESKKLKATFYVFSHCDESYNLSLEQTQKNILKDFSELKTQNARNIQMISREGLSTEFSGKIDGIKVSGIITNIQKDYCQFDFVLVESKKDMISVSARSAFDDFLKGFKF